MNANSDRLRPSSTRRALASLGVHPWRVAIRLSRLPLSAGRRMLITTERVVPIKSPLQSIVTLVTIVAHLALGQMRGYLSEGGCQACGTQNQSAVTTASDGTSRKLRLLVFVLGLFQFQNPAILEGERQLMAKSFPAPNDGFSNFFAFFVELIHMLHRPPVGNVPVVPFSKEAVQHSAAGEKPISVHLTKMSLSVAVSDGIYGA